MTSVFELAIYVGAIRLNTVVADCLVVLSDSAMQDSQARLQAISAQLRDLSMQRVAAMRQAKQVAKCEQHDFMFPSAVLRAALFIYERSGWNMQPAMRFLQMHGRKKRFPPLADAVAEVTLETYFLAVDLEELLQEPENLCGVRIFREAKRWLQEWSIVSWGHDLNMSHGVAPSTASLLEKARAAGDLLPRSIHARTRHGRPGRTARMWAHRFRKRWNAVIGKIKQNEYVPPDVLQARVTVLSCSSACATLFNA